MTTEIQPNAQAFNDLYNVTTDPIITAETGDEVNSWQVVVIPPIKLLNEMHNVINGQLLIGSTTAGCLVKAIPTGSNGILVTVGEGSLNFGLNLIGDITVAGGGATLAPTQRTRYASSVQIIDLAGGAVVDVPIFMPDQASTIFALYLEFTAAAGSVAAAVSVGKPGDTGYYVNAALTNTAAPQWSKQTLPLLAADVGANQSVICSTNGIGDAGKVLVHIAYQVN